ncbi:COX2_CUA domain-containing protein, partial [Haematococcus lacustris]
QVAIPLPKPILPLQLLDEYKLQLSFDGDRQLTPWLTIMGKGAPSVPVVEVVLRSSGSELLGVTASVATAPIAYQHKHMQLVQEFKNASHWPKHLLVRYHFETHNEVDLNRGLAVLFIAVAGSSDKVAAFLAEVTAEDSMAVGRSSARGSMAKAE